MEQPPLRVCMFSNVFPPIPTGSATQVAALSRALAARGHTVDVVTARVNQDTASAEDGDGLRIHRLPAFRVPPLRAALAFPWLTWTLTPANLWRIAAIVGRSRADVLHAHNHMFDLSIAAAIASRRRRIPLVVTLHTPIRHPEPRYDAVLRAVDRVLLKRIVINPACVVICPDRQVQRYAAETFGRSDAMVIPYGIDPPAAPDAARVRRIREEHALDGPVVLSLGHVHEKRHRLDLIGAMPAILRAHARVKLIIVGAVGDPRPARLASQLGVSGAVVFTGAVSHADVPAYLELADLEAHWLTEDRPDDMSLGVASLEAMAAGRTVVAAAHENCYGDGVLRNGDNIVIVDPVDTGRLAATIVTLLDDASRRRGIGARARQTIQDHFAWDAVCAKTRRAYDEAAGRPPAPRSAHAVEERPDVALHL